MMQIAGSLTDRLAAAGVNYAPQIVSAAQSHELDPALLAAVAAQETGGPGSNGGANVVGDGGHGRGLFQIDDRWHPFARSAAAMDPKQNANFAAGMISGLLKRYGGDVHQALSAYNAGSPTATGTRTTWADGQTLGYADSVLRHYSEITGTHLDEARCEQTETASSVNALGTLAQLLAAAQTPAQLPSLPTRSTNSWQHQRGLDATGHTTNKPSDYSSYIDGD